jgi:hypothetical protein
LNIWKRIERAADAAAEQLPEVPDLSDLGHRAHKSLRRARKLVARSAKETLKRTIETATGPIQKAEEALAPSGTVLLPVRRFLQVDGYSCGVQCTAMALSCFDLPIDLRRLERELGTTEDDGTNQGAIRRVLKKHGCATRQFDAGRLRDLRGHIDRGEPIIACVDDDRHWLVVYGYGPDLVFVCDPNPLNGLMGGLDRREFRRRWDGYGIAVRHD